MADGGRVVAGHARGLRLAAPGEGTRPLGDRVKQALFGALDAAWGGAWPGPFLDLFAGSGAAGIEALSRGAPGCLFVEHDRDAVRVIEDNLRRSGLTGPAGPVPAGSVRVLRADVLRLLGAEVEPPGPFAAAIVDPPYAASTLVPALEALAAPGRGWLVGEPVVVAKSFWRDALPASIGPLVASRDRRFGETKLTFYRGAHPSGEGMGT